MGNQTISRKVNGVCVQFSLLSFYSGDRSWNVPLTLGAIMDIPSVLSQFVPKFDTLFLSVKDTDVTDLTKTDHPFGWLLTVFQKEGASKDRIVDALVEAMSHLKHT